MKVNRRTTDLHHISYPADTIRNNNLRYICVEDRFYLAAENNKDTINEQVSRDFLYSLRILKAIKMEQLSDFNEDRML